MSVMDTAAEHSDLLSRLPSEAEIRARITANRQERLILKKLLEAMKLREDKQQCGAT